MKKLAFIFALIATAACASPRVVWQDGTVRSYWPSTIAWPDGRDTNGANVEQCIAAGVARWETEAEWTEREAAETQAAQAAADAQAAQESLPAVFPSGIAVLDAAGHHIELVPAGDGLPVLGYQVSNSPLDKSQRDTMKAERAAASAALAATAKDAKINDKKKIVLLMKAVFGINE